jgi:hypothetical protein
MHQRKMLTICCCLVPSLLHNSNVQMDSRSDQEVSWMAVAPAGNEQVSCATTAKQKKTKVMVLSHGLLDRCWLRSHGALT